MGLVSVCTRLTLVTAVCVAGLAYYLYTPLPPDIDEAAIAHLLSAVFKMTRLFMSTTLLRQIANLDEVIQTTLDVLRVTLLTHSQERAVQFLGSQENSVQIRRKIMRYTGPKPVLDRHPDIQVTDQVFDGVHVRVYRPQSAPLLAPAYIQFHGGGFCMGSVDLEDSVSRYIARQGGLVVVSVEYRLAPENPFPAPLDDCVTATVYVLKHGAQLGIDVTKVGVGGMSAGGNLAAATALRLLDSEYSPLSRLRYQALLVPVLQALYSELPSYLENAEIMSSVISREDMATYDLAYAGLDISPAIVRQVLENRHVRPATKARMAKYVSLVEGENSWKEPTAQHVEVNETLADAFERVFLNPLASPLFADEDKLKQVPPAVLVMSQYDILRDDAVLYARRLQRAGVPVTSHLIPNGHHISLIMRDDGPGSTACETAYATVIQFITNIVST